MAICGDTIVQEGVEGCDDGNKDDTDMCTNGCATAKCGDMIVEANVEACDDGNADETDMCTSMCQLPKCGDGFIQMSNMETCDDKMESKTCDADCTAASCGDNVLNKTAGEVCDDGNMINTDLCVGACVAAKCGDGFVQAGVEACDDGNMIDNDACSNTCKLPVTQKFIFVSSVMYTGNLGGLGGADAKCQGLAQAAGLPGTYMAWLSDGTGSPSTRMTKAAVPYVRPDGMKVANNWADLTDNNLIISVNQTETKGAVPVGNTSCGGGGFKTVWTNTNANGTQANANNSCTNWTSGNGSSIWGRADLTDSSWSFWCSGGLCSWNSPIYCVQQ
jgi:cysteine-rich repeat protein